MISFSYFNFNFSYFILSLISYFSLLSSIFYFGSFGLPLLLFLIISSLQIYYLIKSTDSSLFNFSKIILINSLFNNIFLNGYIFLNVLVMVTSDVLNISDNYFFYISILFIIPNKYIHAAAIDID